MFGLLFGDVVVVLLMLGLRTLLCLRFCLGWVRLAEWYVDCLVLRCDLVLVVLLSAEYSSDAGCLECVFDVVYCFGCLFCVCIWLPFV